MKAANLSMLETDGPYCGNPCGSHDHDHYDAADSVEMQWRGQADFYALMRQHGVCVRARACVALCPLRVISPYKMSSPRAGQVSTCTLRMIICSPAARTKSAADTRRTR